MPPYIAGPHPWADKFVSRDFSDGFGQLAFVYRGPPANQLDGSFLIRFVCKEIPHHSRFSLGIESRDPYVPSCRHRVPQRWTPARGCYAKLKRAGSLDQAATLAYQLEETMISPTMSTRIALVLASFGVSLATLAPVPAKAQNQNMEVIHHPNYERVHAGH
jgi:hypothetical protein